MASQAAFDLLLLCHFVYLSLTRLVKHSYSVLRANSFSLDGFSPSANISFRSFYLWDPLKELAQLVRLQPFLEFLARCRFL